MPDTDFSEIARDRINKKIDGFDKLQSKEEFNEKLDKFIEENKGWKNLKDAKRKPFSVIREEIWEGGAKQKVEENNQNALAEALKFEAERKERARVRDESKTHRITKRASWRTVRRWKKDPSRMDIQSVDTRVGRRSSKRIKQISRRVRITKQDRMRKNLRVFVNPFTLGKVYQSRKTGRFVKVK